MDGYDRQRIGEIKSKIFQNKNEISRLYDDIKSYQEIKRSMRGDQQWEVEREISDRHGRILRLREENDRLCREKESIYARR